MSGQITWVELPATDTTRARVFYNGLFGWNTSEYGEDYHVIDNGPTGAIAPRDESFTHPRVYLATDDIDASVKRLHELGGTSGEVQDIPGVGRIAHCQDDQGTPFSLHEPAPQD